MPKPNRLPTELIEEYLELDPTAKYGLRWKRSIYRQIKKGDEAGYLKPGRTNKIGYAAVRLKGVVYYVHRIIYYLYTKTDPELFTIDHIDGNTLNNAVTNLRLATNTENQRNRTSKNKNNKSSYKGVTWDKNRNKWLAQISVNGKNKFLGRYDSLEKAASTYDKAALIYYGEFSYLNTQLHST